MNLISLKVIHIIVALSFTILSACSGGGSITAADDSTGANDSNSTTPALSFQILVGAGTDFPVIEIYNVDLNSDGIDEVIIAGRKTASTSPNWQNFNIQIFGWNNSNTFSNETSTWFSGTDNVIIGTDQAVKFGDFDGDGRVDMITSASTDDSTRSIYGQTIVYHQNTSGVFTRSVVTNQATNLWSHDLVVYDFNDDGRMDFLASDYGSKTTMGFGNADDTFTLHTTGNGSHSASGIAVGNFNSTNGTQYGKNSVEIIMSDSGLGTNTRNDTVLFTWSVVDPTVAGTLTLTKVSVLPPAANSLDVHTIRVFTFDYDADSKLDIVAFSRQLSVGGTSTIQFFKGDGTGGFTEPANVLSGYTSDEAGVNYQPRLISVDASGGKDIFLSGFDFNGSYDSTKILVNNDDGTFTTTYTSNFATNWNNKKNATTNANVAGMPQQIVLGPSNNYYIVTFVLYDVDGTRRAAVYTTNLGTTIATGL